MTETLCPSCAAPLTGNYCAECGERRDLRGRLRFGTLVAAAISEVADIEHSKLLLTLRTLFFRPGVMTREFWNGAHRKYIGPVKLFITMFAISLFVYTAMPSTAVFDLNTSIANDRTGSYRTLITQFAEKAQTSTTVFVAEANQRWQRYIYWSQIVYPIVLAVALKLLFWNRGRYLAEHAIFAMHYVTFSLAIGVLSWPLYALSGVGISWAFSLVALSNVVIWFAYMFFAMRTVYAGRKLITALRAAIALTVYFVGYSGAVLLAMLLAMFRTAQVLKVH